MRAPSITNLHEWREYVRHDFDPPTWKTPAEYARLDIRERATYNKTRTDWLNEKHVIILPTVEAADRNLRDVVRRATPTVVSPRDTWYAVLTGDAATGKSTAATWLGRKYELRIRAETGREDDDTFAPVVYIELPGTLTEKTLMGQFLTFLGERAPSERTDVETRTDRVVETPRALGTSLVIIDDVHLIRPTSTTGRSSANTLTRFSRRVPAGFMYAGLNVQDTNLFAGDVGRQTKGRAKVTRFTTYGHGTAEQRETWLRIVLTVEADLCLHDHPARALAPLSEYLWNRTGGSVSTLVELVSTTAQNAIDDGTERVTRAGLEHVEVDAAAHEAEEDRNARPSGDGRRTR